MIILKPTGGLCNRMRAINSAIALCEQTGHGLQVIWEENQWLNCNYHELFRPNAAFSVKSLKQNFLYNTSHAGVYPFPRKQLHGIFNNIMFEDAFFDNDGGIGKTAMGINAGTIRAIDKKKKIYISSGHSFFPSAHAYKQFIPTAAVHNKVYSFMRGWNNKPIGLHIRRTDHAASISESSDAMFEQVMREELKKDGNTLFFMATDSPETEQHFKNIFGNSVVAYPKAWGRDSAQGIIDATVDLYLLSQCSKIYASFQSSFSETAAIIGNIPLQVVKR
jgi:hypothetical protein